MNELFVFNTPDSTKNCHSLCHISLFSINNQLLKLVCLRTTAKALPCSTSSLFARFLFWLVWKKLYAGTSYIARSAARVSPWTHVILGLRKRPPRVSTLCGNLFVCKWYNNILCCRDDWRVDKHTKQCPSWAPGMVWQESAGTTPRKVQGNDHAAETIYCSPPSSSSWQQHHKLDNLRNTPLRPSY